MLFSWTCTWKKTRISTDCWERILVLPKCTYFLQALSLLLLFVAESLDQETWDTVTAVWIKDINLISLCLGVLSLCHILALTDWQEMGKAVMCKQHGKLFYPFALEDGLSESIGEVLWKNWLCGGKGSALCHLAVAFVSTNAKFGPFQGMWIALCRTW